MLQPVTFGQGFHEKQSLSNCYSLDDEVKIFSQAQLPDYLKRPLFSQHLTKSKQLKGTAASRIPEEHFYGSL